MRLYHGTSSANVSPILQEGLRPRMARPGNWDEYPSRQDMVYLTETYAPYFALCASGDDDDLIILEIDVDRLDKSLLFPDEDFIAQALSHQTGEPLDSLHQKVRSNLGDYQHHAMDSVKGLGNLCHKGVVPPGAITRYCRIDMKRQGDVSWIACDPCISLMNYRFCADKYRSITAWLFGDRPDFLFGVGGNEMHVQMMEQYQPGYRQQVEAMFANKDGITVVPVECVTEGVG